MTLLQVYEALGQLLDDGVDPTLEVLYTGFDGENKIGDVGHMNTGNGIKGHIFLDP